LTYVNGEFERLTGYGPEVLGKDCRFLQGEDTDPEPAAALREALHDEQETSFDILNYRANGQKFWNRLTVAPIHDASGDVIRFVGFQTDITDRKIRERRLEVMGRVLNHNLRNKMNLIEGYTELLRSDPDEKQRRKSLDVIAETTDDLMRIAEAVRKIDHTLSQTEPAEQPAERTAGRTDGRAEGWGYLSGRQIHGAFPAHGPRSARRVKPNRRLTWTAGVPLTIRHSTRGSARAGRRRDASRYATRSATAFSPTATSLPRNVPTRPVETSPATTGPTTTGPATTGAATTGPNLV
jgi:PAS domain S-box-containing protein